MKSKLELFGLWPIMVVARLQTNYCYTWEEWEELEDNRHQGSY
jgi:hypothetical protein